MSIAWKKMLIDVQQAQGLYSTLQDAESTLSNPNLTVDDAENELKTLTTLNTNSEYSSLLSNSNVQSFYQQISSAAESVLTSSAPLVFNYDGYGNVSLTTSTGQAINFLNNNLNTTVTVSTKSWDSWDGNTFSSASGFNSTDVATCLNGLNYVYNTGGGFETTTSRGVDVTIQSSNGPGTAVITFTGTASSFGLVSSAASSVSAAISSALSKI